MSEVLNKYDFSFQKKYGQNFLRDYKIPRRIAAECTEYERDGENKIPALILEIGPGAGILTKELAAVFEKVIAVEIDRSLEPILAETLSGYDNIEVVFGDIMETDVKALLGDRRKSGGADLPVSVCANLPYYITTPILTRLVEDCGIFDYITVMVQKEVALRLTSAPGSADYGSITASMGLYGAFKRLFTVPSGCFYPRPKVDSAVVRLSMVRPEKYSDREKKAAQQLIKAAFSVRRKTLVNALSGIVTCDKALLASIISDTLGYGENVRGERLSSEDFVKMAKALEEYTITGQPVE